MSAVASGLSFEVLRFIVEPVSAEVALLELEGRFRADTRRRLGVPRLMAESDDGSREVAPAAADEAQADPDGGLWRASYAVALELLEDGTFALAVGRELLVGLPAPDSADATGDREVRLAREANALRRNADEARAAAAAALASADTERQAREAAEARMAEARMARDDHARRAASLDDELAQLRREHAAELVRSADELAQLRREHAAELVRRDEERDAALSGRDEEAARAADERAAELEAEAAEARRALRAARAEAEAMRRDLERERERAEAADATVRRGRVTKLDGEPLEGDPAADAPTAVIDHDAARAAARAEADRPAAGEDVTEVATREPREPVTGDPGETVRVLGTRRPRRTGEGRPAEPAPGTAAIGARHIEPGQTARRGAVAEWLTRALAVAALGIVVLALVLVVKPF